MIPAPRDAIEKSTLPGGVRVLTQRHEDVHSTTIGVWLRAGSIYETARESGIAHLLEHMVFKGTRRRSMARIAACMDELGAGMNAFTEREFVCYYAKVLSEHTQRAFDLMCEFVTQPLLDPSLLEIEKSVVVEEIRAIEDNPEEMIEDVFVRNLWNRSRWGRPIVGSPRTVASLGVNDLREFMARHYLPVNCVVVAVGDVCHERVVRWATRNLSEMPGAGQRPVAPPREPRPTRVRQVRRTTTECAHLMIGAPSFAHDDTRRHAASVLDSILCGGYSSRLFQEVREKRGLCYSIGSAGASYRSTGFWAVGTSVAPDNATKATALIARELRRVRDDGVRSGELKRAKRMARINVLLSQESSSAQMGRIARGELYYGAQKPTGEILSAIETVSAEDVQRVARVLFDPDTVSLTAIGPIPENQTLELDL